VQAMGAAGGEDQVKHELQKKVPDRNQTDHR
jgi:hypothetical protein